jgi:hypothetical protein
MRTLLMQEHAAAVKNFLVRKSQHKDHVALIRMLMCNNAVVGRDNAAHNRGSGLQMVTDSPRTIFARMEERLGAPSTESALIMLEWYNRVSTFAPQDYFRIEDELHTDLSSSGHQKTDMQRALSFRE